MDRLICGDVGFGKTEVAMRAAFVAAMSGVQVAVVAPTTLLARQHYKTFAERFRGLPVAGPAAVALRAGQGGGARRATGSRDGTVEIVVGTHALLAKSVRFANLGLLVIDEEQHFGVAHKERLKELRSDVHVLTLTATPIPRTLQMSLSGVRELQPDRDAAGRPAGDPHLRQRVRPGDHARGAAARALPRRAGVLRRAAHLRPARDRGLPARAGARGRASSSRMARWRRASSTSG